MIKDYPNAIGDCGTFADTYNKQYLVAPYGPGDFHTTCASTHYQVAANVSETELYVLIFPRMR
jgi:hypothetical protein